MDGYSIFLYRPYFAGFQNPGDNWLASGSRFLQLTINLKSEWKYVPEKYIIF